MAWHTMTPAQQRESVEALKRAMEGYSSVGAFADAVGVSRRTVYNWIERRVVSLEWVLEVERASQGQATRHDLRPDKYPA